MNIQAMLVIAFFFVAQALGEPLLVVVLMVKDEAPVITQTLQPFVDGGVRDFVIFDTGSTDGTQDVVREFFEQHDLMNAHIIQEPFIDFSTSRNHALYAAQHIFPHATFMLMPDAEWYIHNVEALLQFCSEHADDCHASYLVPIRSASVSFYVPRLIRCHKNIQFVGVVHEVLNEITTIVLPHDSYFEWRPSKKGREKSIQRWQRDRDLLLKSYEQNPYNARTLFYLAQTYDCLGDWENAYTFYKKRADIYGWHEENFVTRLRLGNVAQQLALTGDANAGSLAIRHYLEAFALSPHRAEPLIKIAQYYLERNELREAFLFAARAAKIPYPESDILPVEKYMYDFVRYDILARCAWCVGEYTLGEWAVMQALQANPAALHLKRYLELYTMRRQFSITA